MNSRLITNSSLFSLAQCQNPAPLKLKPCMPVIPLILSKAGVKRELLDTIEPKARKLAYYGHTMRNKGVA